MRKRSPVVHRASRGRVPGGPTRQQARRSLLAPARVRRRRFAGPRRERCAHRSGGDRLSVGRLSWRRGADQRDPCACVHLRAWAREQHHEQGQDLGPVCEFGAGQARGAAPGLRRGGHARRRRPRGRGHGREHLRGSQGPHLHATARHADSGRHHARRGHHPGQGGRLRNRRAIVHARLPVPGVGSFFHRHGLRGHAGARDRLSHHRQRAAGSGDTQAASRLHRRGEGTGRAQARLAGLP